MTSPDLVESRTTTAEMAPNRSSPKDIGLKEVPKWALTECKVFALRGDMLSAFPIPHDILCLSATNIDLAEELRMHFPNNGIHVEGASVRKGEFNRLRTLNPTTLQVYQSFVEVVERITNVNLSLVVIDGSPDNAKFIRRMLGWSADRLRRGNGFLLIRRYAYWRKAGRTNEMVPAINEFIRSRKLSMVGLALNGDGKPDVLIKIASEASGA